MNYKRYNYLNKTQCSNYNIYPTPYAKNEYYNTQRDYGCSKYNSSICPSIMRCVQPFNYEKNSNSLFLTENGDLLSIIDINQQITKSNISNETIFNKEVNTNSIIPFPDVNPSWFTSGFPDELVPQQVPMDGLLINVVPVNYIALVSKNYRFEDLGTNSYWLRNGQIVNGTLTAYANAGELIATAMFDINRFARFLVGSKIESEGSWRLLQDFGGIDAGSSSRQSVSVTSGITNTEGFSSSYSIGYTAGIQGSFQSLLQLSIMLSTVLTTSFSTQVSITESKSVTTTVDYLPQPKDQRIGLYQFYRSYGIIPSEFTKEIIVDRKFDQPVIYRDLRFELATTTSPYATNHFQKVFVLDPNG